MSLETRLLALAQAVGADIKTLYAQDAYGVLAQSDNPALATTTFKPNSGTLILSLAVASGSRVNGATLTVNVQVATAGATLTAGQNLIGIYTSNGTTLTRVGVSADQSSAWTTTGLKTIGIVMNAPVALGSSLYLGLLSVGATIPTFQAPAAAPLINTGVRRRSIVVAQNSMPLTIPVSSLAGSITNVAITVT